MSTRARSHADDGFTLIELLISVLILGIVVSGITTAMIVSLDSLVGRAQAVTDTTGAQILSAYLVADAQSADQVNPASTCDDGTATRVLLELRWTDADATTGTSDVVYRTQPTSGSGSTTDYRLVRDLYSVTTGPNPCSLTSETVVVRDVSSIATDTKALCDGGSTCNNSSSQVGLQVAACVSDVNNNTCGSVASAAYVFQVSGTRRTS
ncbi:MAG: type II secretion system protein [Mycobacteriales bacterium]